MPANYDSRMAEEEMSGWANCYRLLLLVHNARPGKRFYHKEVMNTSMRKIWPLALLVPALLATGIGVGEVPNLVGNWTGSGEEYFKGQGYSEGLSINMTVIEQKGRLFTGDLTYELNGTETVEGFAGAVGLDNRTFYVAEFNEGFDLGTVVSEDEIELLYLQDGAKAQVEIDRLHRA
jgi:hypothetical protein